MAQDGQTVDAGDVRVKIPRETAKQKDITGGLPRVVELFEVLCPKEPAVIAEVNGLVKFGDVTKSHPKVLVVIPDGEEHECHTVNPEVCGGKPFATESSGRPVILDVSADESFGPGALHPPPGATPGVSIGRGHHA